MRLVDYGAPYKHLFIRCGVIDDGSKRYENGVHHDHRGISAVLDHLDLIR